MRIAGIATLTIVASIDTISRLRQQDTRMMALRRALWGPVIMLPGIAAYFIGEDTAVPPAVPAGAVRVIREERAA